MNARIKLNWLSAAACSMLAFMLAQSAAAQSDVAKSDTFTLAAVERVITPDAQAVLDRMTATLNTLREFSVSAQITRDEMLPFGYKLQRNDSAQMLVVRPDSMRVESRGDTKDRTYVYDGKQFTIFDPDENIYVQTEAPPTVEAMIDKLLDTGVELPLLDVLIDAFSGPGVLTAQVQSGLLVGESSINGIEVDQLAFRQANVDWQVWVQKGEHALPIRFVITTRYELGDPQVDATLNWDLKPSVAATSFRFVPPKDARKVPVYTGGAVSKESAQ